MNNNLITEIEALISKGVSEEIRFNSEAERLEAAIHYLKYAKNVGDQAEALFIAKFEVVAYYPKAAGAKRPDCLLADGRAVQIKSHNGQFAGRKGAGLAAEEASRQGIEADSSTHYYLMTGDLQYGAMLTKAEMLEKLPYFMKKNEARVQVNLKRMREAEVEIDRLR